MRQEKCRTSPGNPSERSGAFGLLKRVGFVGCVFLFCLPGFAAAPATVDAPPERAPTRSVLIGVVESSETDFPSTTLRPTIEAIERHVPGARVSVVRLSSITLLSDIDRVRPDLFIAPSADFRRVLDATGAHPIATRLSTAAVNPAQSVGAAFVVRSDRSDMATLADLKGKRTAATLPTALDGWLAARLEVQEAGYDSKDFFGDVHFMTYGVPNVVSSVLAGQFDVGILPACALERAQAQGLVEPGALKVIAPVTDELLACRHSTRLYPDWVAGALPGTDPELARLMTIALLTPVKPDDSRTNGRAVCLAGDERLSCGAGTRTEPPPRRMGLFGELDPRSPLAPIQVVFACDRFGVGLDSFSRVATSALGRCPHAGAARSVGGTRAS